MLLFPHEDWPTTYTSNLVSSLKPWNNGGSIPTPIQAFNIIKVNCGELIPALKHLLWRIYYPNLSNVFRCLDVHCLVKRMIIICSIQVIWCRTQSSVPILPDWYRPEWYTQLARMDACYDLRTAKIIIKLKKIIIMIKKFYRQSYWILS